jgi:hypothetical protein
MKHYISAFLIAGFVAVMAGMVTPAFATQQDNCNQEFTYTKSSDYDDNRVDINFENGDEQIDVSAKSGYAVIKVELEVSDDGQPGFVTYATGPVSNLNPNPGGDIQVAKVTVKKVCNTPTPTPSVTITATPTPTPVVDPCNQEKLSLVGRVYAAEVDPCVTPTATPEPTNPPSNPGGPGDGKSDGKSDGRSSCPECTAPPTGQVLGASTDFAATGTAAETLMNVIGSIGAFATAAGVALKKRMSK